MYKNRTILGLVTARGGSKGIPKKNVKLLGGRPLISWTIDAALKSKYVDRLVLSSDDSEIIAVAERSGCEVPFIRPAELAQDDTGHMEVIFHALKSIGETYDYLLLLQPTSPFRKAEDIDGIIESCIDQGGKMMVSVARLKKHPAFMYELDGPYLKSFFPTKDQLRRQDMPEAFEYNGALYFSSIDFLKKAGSYNVPEAMAYEMFGPSNLDIDDNTDWLYAECLVNQMI